MTRHPVSTLVNKPANDDQRCVEVVGNEEFEFALGNGYGAGHA